MDANVKAEDIPTEGMSIVAWINVESVTGLWRFSMPVPVIIHGWCTPKHAAMEIIGGSIGVRVVQTIFDIRGGENKANEWIHYAGTFSRAEGLAVLYINGENVGEEKARVGTPIAGDWDSGARVGRNIDDNRPFTGLMDDRQHLETGFDRGRGQ